MSSVKWTDDQEKAISTTGKGVIVSAAAGSGKTAVLIERVIRLLCDSTKKISADKLLAVTFTNEAAAQMRDKLNSAFEKKLSENPNDKWLLKQQNLLQLARISTINSFCLDFVKGNLNQFEFQGDLKILEDTDQKLIRETSFELAMEELCREEEQKYNLLYNSFRNINSDLKAIVTELYEFLRTVPFRQKWIDDASKNYVDESRYDSYFKELFKGASSKLRTLNSLLDKMVFYNELSYCENVEFRGGEYIKNADLLRDNCKKIVDEIHNFCMEKDFSKIKSLKPEKQKKLSVVDLKKLPDEIAEAFDNDLSVCQSIVDEYNKLSEEIKKLQTQFKVESNEAYGKFAEIADEFDVLSKRTDDILCDTIKGGKTYFLHDYLNAMPKNVEAVCESINVLKRLVNAENFGGLKGFIPQKLSAVRYSNEKDIPEAVKAEFDDFKNDFAEIGKAVAKTISDILNPFEISKERYIANLRKANDIFLVMCDVADKMEKISFETKLEKNGVDFGDVERMAKDLLICETEDGYERTPLAEEIRTSHMYEIIMIDEFQDVNNLQELIFRTISDSDNINIMGKNVFVVGDAKQAIYRFRHTNPQLYKRCLADALDEENKDFLEAIYLKRNFRSRKEIVNSVNFIFRNLMSADCGEVEYNDNEKLEMGAGYADKDISTEIMLMSPDEDFEKGLGYSLENLLVAQRIRKLLDSSERVEQYKDNPDGRICVPSDICVLVQTNKEIVKMTNALKTVNLKAYCEDTDGYIKSREISIMINILRIIDNPMNDIAVTAVMMSPVFNFTPDEMTVIRNKCKTEEKHYMNHIYQVLTGCASDENNEISRKAEYIDMGNKLLQKKCVGVYKFVDTLIYYSMSMSLERLIRKIFDMTDLMGLSSLYLDADKKRANLRLLNEYANSYEQSSQNGISGFLRYIDSVSGNESAFKQAVSVTAGENSVNIKTYHKSKGLEYPFVFLCELDKKLIRDKGKANFHNTLGCGFNYVDNDNYINRRNLYNMYLCKISTAEEKSEKLRLLYVGCTRAKEKLFISCMKPDKPTIDNITSDILLNQNTMLDWILLVLEKYPKNEVLKNWIENECKGISRDEHCEDVNIEFVEYIYNKETEQQEEKKEEKLSANQLKVSQLKKRFDFKYDKELSLLPSKLSVSEIVANEKEKNLGNKNPEFYPNLPRLNEEKDKLTGAERGTFTHKFMELANYKNARESVKNELQRLCEKGYFTKKEASGVYVDKLEEFFKTAFFERMNGSADLRREQKFLVAMKDLDLPESLSFSSLSLGKLG